MPGMKFSKHAKGFVEKYNIERFLGLDKFDPNQFTEQEKKDFDAYKKEQDKKRSNKHYQKRVAEGNPPRRKPVRELSPEELEHTRRIAKANAADLYARKQKMYEFAKKNRIPVDIIKNETITSLENKLSDAGFSSDKIKAIKIDSSLDKEKINKNDVDDETKRKRAMSAESAGKGYARRQALYDEATKYAAMPSFQTMTIETIRSVLRRHIDEARIKELETNASREYDDTHELVARKEPVSRSSELLNKFFDAFPEVPRVTMVGQMSSENQNKYNRFQRSLDPERYRAQSRKWDEEHREERKEAAKMRRIENYDHVREIERQYEKSEKGTLKSFFNDTKNWAFKNDIPFEITKEQIIDISKNPCFYCKDLYDEYCVDAVDVATGFVKGNVKPCCRLCNRFKKDHNYKDFVRIMCNIGFKHSPTLSQWTPNYQFLDPRKDLKSSSFKQYACNQKGREFQLTETEFHALTNQACHYCGILKKNGIDRVDSKQGYIPGNMVASCAPCNLMKNNFSKQDFIDKAVKIFREWGVSYFNDGNQ